MLLLDCLLFKTKTCTLPENNSISQMRDIELKNQPSTFQVLSHPNICCLDKYIHSFIKHVQTVAEASAGKQQ